MPTPEKGTVTARVRLTVEVPSGSCWNPTTTMAQIRKQAVDDALGELRNAFKEQNYRILGEPEVIAILADGGKAL